MVSSQLTHRALILPACVAVGSMTFPGYMPGYANICVDIVSLAYQFCSAYLLLSGSRPLNTEYASMLSTAAAAAIDDLYVLPGVPHVSGRVVTL